MRRRRPLLGRQRRGQLGDGTTATGRRRRLGCRRRLAAVSAGDTHTCALTTAGGVRCWGHNGDGELGIGSYDLVLSPPGTDVLSGVKQVVAGNLFTCALMAGGGVRCWGYNSHGGIGDDTALEVDRRCPRRRRARRRRAPRGGLRPRLRAHDGGGVRCWGSNDAGQLGDGMAPELGITPPARDTPGFGGTCE